MENMDSQKTRDNYTFTTTGSCEFENIQQLFNDNDFPLIEVGTLGGVKWNITLQKEEFINISPKIQISENDKNLSFRLNFFILVENWKFPNNEAFTKQKINVYLKPGRRITGKSMNIYELFDYRNGWITSENSLKVSYGIQMDAIQKSRIWRFNFSDLFFNGREKKNGIRLEYGDDFIIAEEDILKFHFKIFSDENSGFLGEFKDFKLLEECMQCAHGVRIEDSKIPEILPIAHNLKLFNVIRYCEQKLMEKIPRGEQIPIELILKYRLRHYLGYLLEKEKSKKEIWEYLRKMDLDELDAETMKCFVAKYFLNFADLFSFFQFPINEISSLLARKLARY